MKAVLVVEDNQFLGENLCEALEDRGFLARHAPDRATAIEMVAPQAGESFVPDVAILDMNLGRGPSGADVGMTLRSLLSGRTPECLVYSAYDDAHYYQAALRLGAAAYLNKAGNDYRAVITRVRILAIRHALRNLEEKIIQMVKQSDGVEQALEDVMCEILLPELELSLGARFFLIFSCNEIHRCLGGTLQLPKLSPVYASLQKRMASVYAPSCLDLSDGPGEVATELEKTFYREHADTLVIPLHQSSGLQVSLGIENISYQPGSLVEQAYDLVEAINEHLRSDIIERLFSVTRTLAEEEMRKREQLAAAARVCYLMGRTQKELYENLPKGEDGALLKIKEMGQQFDYLGQQLDLVQRTPTFSKVSINDLVTDVWHSYAGGKGLDLDFQAEQFHTVLANKPSLSLAMGRIFSWMVGRGKLIEDKYEPKITVSCSGDGPFLQVLIQDQSKRLPQPMLNSLFEPFSDVNAQSNRVQEWMGLYLAKMLVEVSNQGRLEDRSKKLQSPVGHQLCMQLKLG